MIPALSDSFALSLVAGCVMFILCFAVLMSLYLVYVRFYIKSYFYDANDSFITIKKGVFTPKEIHLQFSKIQDVYVDQDLIDRVLGIYDVHISSATFSSGLEAHIDGVDKATADKLRDFILHKITAGENSKPVPVQESISNTTPNISGESALKDVSKQTYPFKKTFILSEAIKQFFGTIGIMLALAFFAFVRLSKSFEGKSFSYLFSIFVFSTIVVFLCRMLYFFVWLHNYSFSFANQFIVMKRGVFALSEIRMPFSSVQNILVEQSFIERLFGIGNITIENAASDAILGGQMKRTAQNTSNISIIGLDMAKATELSSQLREVLVTSKTTKSYGL